MNNDKFFEKNIKLYEIDEILKKISEEIISFLKMIIKKYWYITIHKNCIEEYVIEEQINSIVRQLTASSKHDIDSFSNFFNGKINNKFNKQEAKILYTNAHLNLLKKFLDFIYEEQINGLFDNKSKINSEILDSIENDYKNSVITYLLNMLKGKNIYFDEKNFFISDKLQHSQECLLDEEKINKIYNNFLLAETITEKENIIDGFSNKMAETLNKLKNDSNMSKIMSEYISKNTITQIIQMTHGYFRHTSKNEQNIDVSDCTNKWSSFDDQEKLKRMNILFSMYLTILIILKNNNLIDDFLKTIA